MDQHQPVVDRTSVLDRLFGDSFRVEKDHGVVVWDPEGASQGATDEPPRSGSCEVTATRIKACIADPESKAEVLRNVQEMQNEVKFHDVRFAKQLPKDERPSGFPHACPRVVALYEAEKRGVDLEKIDFLLGGSFLNACVRPDCFLKEGDNQEEAPEYLVENCKGVLVVNKEDFVGENRIFPTYQFKRWACGRAMEEKHPELSMGHLRVAKIGSFRVLFAASVDALRAGSQQPAKIRMREVKDDTLVELVLQMLSCGAGSLINGTRRKGGLDMLSAASAKLGMFRRVMPGLKTFAHMKSFVKQFMDWYAETGPAAGKPDDDGDAVTAFMEEVMTCYSGSTGFLSCRSAVTHETASSLAINESSRTEQEVFRMLLKSIPPLFENAQRRTWVHYWLVRQCDAFYENWQEKLPAELLPLMQERTGESPHAETEYKYHGDFLGLLRFARNQIMHLGTSERPSENEEAALQYLAEKVAGRRTKDQKLRTKAFAASLIKVLREKFPALHVHVEAVEAKARVWTHAGDDAVKLLGLEDENDKKGDGKLRRAVDDGNDRAVENFLKKAAAHQKAIAEKGPGVMDYVFWRGSDGKHALDAIEAALESHSVFAVDTSDGKPTGHWLNPRLKSIYRMLVEALPSEAMPRPAGLLHRLVSIRPSLVVRARTKLLLEWGVLDRWPDEKTGLTAGETAYVRMKEHEREQTCAEVSLLPRRLRA
eukprot:g822.t1